MGLPVTASTESAAPPRVSPSVLVRITPSDADLLIEGLGHVDGFLTGHGVHDQQGFIDLDCLLDAHQLLHQLVIDLQTACGIENHMSLP